MMGLQKMTGWKRSFRADGRRDGNWLKQALIKSFCSALSRDSMVLRTMSWVMIGELSLEPVISRAAISKAHIPNE